MTGHAELIRQSQVKLLAADGADHIVLVDLVDIGVWREIGVAIGRQTAVTMPSILARDKENLERLRHVGVADEIGAILDSVTVAGVGGVELRLVVGIAIALLVAGEELAECGA